MRRAKIKPWAAWKWAAALIPACFALNLPAAETGFAGFQDSPQFHERVASFALAPDVNVQINAPEADAFMSNRKTLLIFYALPNGSTIAQTVGRRIATNEDWHFNIQHIGAQTRFLRHLLPDENIVVAYLESTAKPIPRSWPLWRKKHGDAPIPGLIDYVRRLFTNTPVDIVLSGHSGGGSLIFGYINAVTNIPDDITRIAFLDSDYAYDPARGHTEKFCHWLDASPDHHLCILAYNDAAARLNGKPFVSAAGGTWGRSHLLLKNLGACCQFTSQTNGNLTTAAALDGRVKFLLMENPERKILHTVQVERNGFIEAMVSGTTNEARGYEYFGERAYEQWIAPRPVEKSLKKTEGRGTTPAFR